MPRQRRLPALGLRRRDALPVRPGRADHADAGLPDPLLRAGVRAARACCSGWIHGVAVANPLTRLIEAVRSLLAGQPFEVGIAFGVAFGLIVVFALWALGGLRRAEAMG